MMAWAFQKLGINPLVHTLARVNQRTPKPLTPSLWWTEIILYSSGNHRTLDCKIHLHYERIVASEEENGRSQREQRVSEPYYCWWEVDSNLDADWKDFFLLDPLQSLYCQSDTCTPSQTKPQIQTLPRKASLGRTQSFSLPDSPFPWILRPRRSVDIFFKYPWYPVWSTSIMIITVSIWSQHFFWSTYIGRTLLKCYKPECYLKLQHHRENILLPNTKSRTTCWKK